MVQMIVVAGFLVFGGLSPSLAIFRSLPLALVVAPLVTALICSIGAFASVLTGTSLQPWLFGLVVGAACIPWITRKAPAATRAPRGPAGRLAVGLAPLKDRLMKIASLNEPARLGEENGRVFTGFQVAFVAALTAFPLAGLQRGPVDWDARSSWFFRAKFFLHGGAGVLAAIRNPAVDFSHQDYPPLAPATSASIWTVLGGPNFRTAQIGTALLTWAVVILIGLSLVELAGVRLKKTSPVVAGMVGLAAYGMAGLGGTNGYVDLLAAASLAFAGVQLLVLPKKGSRNLILGGIGLAVAMATKQEGIALGALILGLALLRYRARAGSPLLLVSLLPEGLWILTVRHLGATGDLLQGSPLARLLDPARFSERIGPILHAFRVGALTFMSLGFAICFLGWITLRTERDRMQWGGSPWIWVTIGGYLVLLIVVYLVSPTEIGWILSTTVDRTLILAKLLVLVDVSVWLLVAISPLAQPALGGAAKPA